MSMPVLSVPRDPGKPQSHHSDGADGIGFIQFWGNSTSVDLLSPESDAAHYGPISDGEVVRHQIIARAHSDQKRKEYAALEEGDDKTEYENDATLNLHEPQVAPVPAEGPLNFLICGAGDIRHIIKTVAKRHQTAPGRELCFYIWDKEPEVLARHVLFLQMINNTALPIRDRVEFFLSIYGNTLVREKDCKYVEEICRELEELVADDGEDNPLMDLIDFSCLTHKQRDGIQEAMRGWRAGVPFDIESLRDQRLRGYYRNRYEYRKNLMDWDFQNCMKPQCGIVHWLHYKEFAHTGVSYETRLASYDTPNRTLASYTEAKERDTGKLIMQRGFWGDVINTPYHAFGTTTHPKDFDRLFKTTSGQYRQHETDIAEFNLVAYLSEMETGEEFHLLPETPDEHERHDFSPLDNLRRSSPHWHGAQEVDEKNNGQPQDGDNVASGGYPSEEKKKYVRNADRAAVTRGARERRRKGKEKKEYPKLVEAFKGVKVTLLNGELLEILKKSKYQGLFHRAWFGSLCILPLLDECQLTHSEANFQSKPDKILHGPRISMPDDFGKFRDNSTFAKVMASGACAIFESMKYQIHFEGNVKLACRHRIAQACHLLGWKIQDERHALPRIEQDAQDKKCREDEKNATDFLRFVTP